MLDARVLIDPLIVTRPHCHAGLLIYNGRYSLEWPTVLHRVEQGEPLRKGNKNLGAIF